MGRASKQNLMLLASVAPYTSYFNIVYTWLNNIPTYSVHKIVESLLVTGISETFVKTRLSVARLYVLGLSGISDCINTGRFEKNDPNSNNCI
jgi:hypothetical protein